MDIVSWLRPFCTHIDVAGSVRREKEMVGDIDLVVVPKDIEEAELFGSRKTSTLLYQELKAYVDRSKGRVKWVIGEENPLGKQFVLTSPKCQLDIYTATPQNMGSVLLCRTGSKEHNAWLSKIALEKGFSWVIAEGLIRTETVLSVSGGSESSIYCQLGIDYIQPRDREPGLMEKHAVREFNSGRGLPVLKTPLPPRIRK